MDKQEQESLWKQAGILAHEMLIHKLTRKIRKELPKQGEKIDIPSMDKLNSKKEGC